MSSYQRREKRDQMRTKQIFFSIHCDIVNHQIQSDLKEQNQFKHDFSKILDN